MRVRGIKIFGIFLIGVLALEGILRILCFTGIVKFAEIDFAHVIHKYADDPGLIYDMKPSFRIVNRHHKEVKTNSHGMRDDEYPVKKPAGVYRIAVVGDSVAFGMYLEHALTFAKVLEKQLNQHRKTEVLNFSVSGYNATQEGIILKNRVPRFDPDLVIIAHCLNDDSYTDGLGELEREMAPSALGPKLHSKLITLILHRIERGIFSKRNDPRKVERLFLSLKEEAVKHRYKTLVLIFPYKYKTLDEYGKIQKHQLAQTFLKENDIEWIDFLDVWRDKSPQERGELYMRDDIVHLSKLGMQEVSDKLYEYLLRAIF